jgi:hypothetical protein
MLLNGVKGFRLTATKSDVKTRHASFVKKVAEFTRIPEQPMLKFVDGAYDRHTKAFDMLTQWATDDFEGTAALASKVVGKQTGGAAVEHSIDLTKSSEQSNSL